MHICVFICIWDVKSTPIQIRKPKSCSHNRKEDNTCFPPVIISFPLVTLSYSTASTSRPIPLPDANSFSRLKLSVCNISYLSPAVLWMYLDSLKFKTESTELLATDASKLSLCCTHNVGLNLHTRICRVAASNKYFFSLSNFLVLFL